jgi:valyl-tRNA synthetase
VLLHPIMPFVTEEVWAHMPGARGLLAVEHWPERDASLIDDEAERAVGEVIEAVTALRRYRDDARVPAAARLPGLLLAEGYEQTADQVARLARFELARDGREDGDVISSVAIPGGAVQVLASGDIDQEEARRSLTTERRKLEEEIGRAEGKLANERFVQKAPREVVEAEREKLERYRAELERLS